MLGRVTAAPFLELLSAEVVSHPAAIVTATGLEIAKQGRAPVEEP